MQRMMSWYNYRTGKMEYIETPKDFSDYMPQDTPHQMLYKLYQEHEGLDPIHAFIKVMEKSAGVEAD